MREQQQRHCIKLLRNPFDSRFGQCVQIISVRFPDSELTELLTPLKPSCWPKDRNSLVLYCEKEIHDLAKHLGVPTRAAVEEYRLWKLEGDSLGKTIKRLIIARKTYLASSAECERGLSAMTDTANKRRKPFFYPVYRCQWCSSRTI